MNIDQTVSLLSMIASKVQGDGRQASGTAPVTLSIGYVARTNMCISDGVVIKDAPGAIVTAIHLWASTQNAPENATSDHTRHMVNVSVDQNGLLIS